jgi:hypothetical protein
VAQGRGLVRGYDEGDGTTSSKKKGDGTNQ